MPRESANTDIVTDVDVLRELAPQWRRLAFENGNADIGPDVFFLWLHHYGDTHQPFVPVIRRTDGSLHGLLPLVLSRDGRRILRYAGGSLGLRTHPVAPLGEQHVIRAAAVEEIARHHAEWRAVILDGTDLSDDWEHDLNGATPRLAAIRTFCDVRYWITFEQRTWDDYLRTRSHHFRSRLKSQLRSLEKAHAVSLHRVTEADFDEGWRVLLDLHLKRWQDRGGSSIAAEREQSFFADFAACALQNQWLRLWLMIVDGAPIAASMNCFVGTRYAGYILGSAPEWSRHSVSRLLLSYVIRDALEEGAREFDLARGGHDYKPRFATHQAATARLTLVRARRPRHLALVARQHASTGKERIASLSSSTRASILNLARHGR